LPSYPPGETYRRWRADFETDPNDRGGPLRCGEAAENLFHGFINKDFRFRGDQAKRADRLAHGGRLDKKFF
jgi:hypothetical protein